MARLMVSKRRRRLFLMLDGVRCVLTTITLIVVLVYLHFCNQYRKRILRSPSYFTNEGRRIQLQNIIFHDDTTCINQLRMNRATFNKLCSMLRTFGKLSDSPNVTVEEMTAMFVHILAHHVKNRVIINKFMRSGETISRHFNSVLKGIIRLQSHLLKNPVAVSENSTDNRWKWFKNCLGALDGTYIRMHVLEEDKPRYRTRKGDIATNVLGVCSQDMQFIFIYPGWEGSAADSRVLRDAVSRRHGLKADTGFKSGYLKEIESMMEAKLPGCGLKGNPHIDSRIRTLKKQTMALAEMINTGSGFSWDHEKHTILCEQSVFDNWCLGHPSAGGLYGRSFPHFDTLNAIYSKDRANGKGATAPAAEEEELEAGEFEEGDNIANKEAATDGMEISDAHTRGSAAESIRKRSKKNNDVSQTGMTEVCGVIHKLVDGTLEYLKEVGRAMKDDTTPSREVAKALKKMDILDVPKMCAAAKVITADEYMTSIFLELPLEKQTEMVVDILKM